MCTTMSHCLLVYDILIYYLSLALSGETGSSEISSLILDLDSLVGLNVEWNSSMILSSLYISLLFILSIYLLHIYYPSLLVVILYK
jgi:hypothetical protein